MRVLLSFLPAILLAAPLWAQDATVWAEHHEGSLTFLLPQRWQNDTKPPARGELYVAKAAGFGTFRIRELAPPAFAQTGLPSYDDAREAPEWKDVLGPAIERGMKLDSAKSWSRMSGATVLDYANLKGKGPDGQGLGILIARWRTQGKPGVCVELSYPGGAGKAVENEVTETWETLTYEPAPTLVFRRPGSKLPVPAARAANPEPALAFSPPASIGAAVKHTPAQLMQEFSGSLVFMESAGSAGSGFICRTKDGVFLLTNQHVAAGMQTIKATRLDGQTVKLGEPGAAVGHDLMRFAGAEAARPFEAGEQIESFAQIGDDIVVLGNAEGSRVINPLPGKLLGLGPDRIEVSAEFVPGNSGSPIIHLATGKVIGIATYLERRRFAGLTNDKDVQIRRFGYRLDSVKQWQRVNWAAYHAEAEALNKVSALTRDFEELLDDLAKGVPNPAKYSTPLIQRVVRDFAGTVNRNNVSAADRQRAVQSFAASLRAGSQADIGELRPRLQYDFFRNALAQETGTRDQLHKVFDELVKKLSR